VAEQRLHAALAAQRVRSEREFFALPLADAVAVIMREFGEDADYFDPHAITPAGKARLAQMQTEAERQKVIDDRVSETRTRLTTARLEQRTLQERLMAAEVGSAAQKREVPELRAQMEELEARIASLTAEYDMACAAWEAAGGMERLLAERQSNARRTKSRK
jgi:multidrug resistance efflux pump